MYCPKCRNEISQTSRFCATCGTNNPNYTEAIPVAPPLAQTPKKNGKAKKIILIGAAIAAVLIAYLIFGGKGIDLKYDWGIEQEEILADGGRYSRADSDIVLVDDEAHEVDRIKEFEISGDVEYIFLDNELVSLHYCFREKGTFEEMIEIVAKYYGDDYYSNGEYEAYWWKDGTVVRLYYGGIMTYWSEDQYLKGYSYNSSRVIEYFEK